MITVALFAVLGAMAVSCQKEMIVEPVEANTEMGDHYLLNYSVDGVSQTIYLNGDEERMAFLRSLAALAREGHWVKVFDSNYSTGIPMTKETVVYRTSDENDAITWANKMMGDGYVVTMYFDTKSGEWVCIAEK